MLVRVRLCFASGIFIPFLLCVRSQLGLVKSNKRSEDREDPGDEDEALEPTVQIADQQFFKMADGNLQTRLTYTYTLFNVLGSN